MDAAHTVGGDCCEGLIFSVAEGDQDVRSTYLTILSLSLSFFISCTLAQVLDTNTVGGSEEEKWGFNASRLHSIVYLDHIVLI